MRPDVPSKSTSQSRGVNERMASRTSSRRKTRGLSSRNATYRYRGRWVLTLARWGRNGKRFGKRGGGQRTSSTSAEVFTGPVYTSLPRRDFDFRSEERRVGKGCSARW